MTPESNNGLNGGPKLINIKKLHDILKDELNIVQSTIATGQRQLIMHEIELVLKYAIDLNAQKNRCASTVRFMEAWSQVTEILFAVAPVFALCYEDRGGFIIEILQALLNKVTLSHFLLRIEKIDNILTVYSGGTSGCDARTEPYRFINTTSNACMLASLVQKCKYYF